MKGEVSSTPGEVLAVWRECLAALGDRIEHPVWKGCLHEIEPLSFKGNALLLQTGSFCHSILNEDVQLQSMITAELNHTLQALTGREYHVEWIASDGPDPAVFESSSEPAVAIESTEAVARDENDEAETSAMLRDCGLNPKYTFATFVEGASNQLAYAASRSVARNPSQSYNPLFLYGGVGLGKTHLMQAIGNGIAAHKKNARVVYVSTETFMNELIEAIGNKTTGSFREKYRSVDALLVDDIQFLINRERTQEEFFHTFNYLHSNDRQIVLTSDRPPHDLHPLEDRLRSRFTQGLIADVQSPDLETREAILRKKVQEQYHVTVPLDVITFIAERFPSSIRDLEGAMIRVIAYASTHKTTIDISLAAEALQQILPPDNGKSLTIRAIQDKVCDHFRVKMADLVGARRDARFALPRQIAMFLAREMTTCSLKQIADEFNKKDHTTVIHAIRKIEDTLSDSSTRESVESIRHRLKEYQP